MTVEATNPITDSPLRAAVEHSASQHRRWLWLAALMEAAWRIGVVWLVLVGVDAIWRLPAAARAVALVAVAAWSAWLLWRLYPRPGRDRILAEARRLERAGELQDNELVNALTLPTAAAAGRHGAGASLAEALASRSLSRGRTAIEGVWAKRSGARRLVRIAARPLVVLVMLIAALGLAMPGLFHTGTWRLLAPWADHPPFSMTRLLVSIEPADVQKGEPAVVRVAIGGRNVEQAHLVQLDARGNELQRWPMRDAGRAEREAAAGREFIHRFSSVTGPIHFRIEAGTARSRQKLIQPRPLEPASLHIELADPPPGGFEAIPGQTVRVPVRVYNRGGRSSTPAQLVGHITGHGDAQPSPAERGPAAAGREVPAIGAGTSTTLGLGVPAPGPPTRRGDYWLHVALVEPDDEAGAEPLWAEPVRLQVRQQIADRDEPHTSGRLLDTARRGGEELQRLQDELDRLMAQARELARRLDEKVEDRGPGAALDEVDQERLDELARRLERGLADAQALHDRLQQAAEGARDEAGQLAQLTEAMRQAAQMLARLQVQDVAADRPGEAAGDPEQGEGHGGVSDAGRAAQWVAALRDAAEIDRAAMAGSQLQLEDAVEALAGLLDSEPGPGDEALDIDPQGETGFDQVAQGEHVDEAEAAAEAIPHRHRAAVRAYMIGLERLLQTRENLQTQGER